MTTRKEHIEPGRKPGLVVSATREDSARSRARTVVLVCRKCEKKLKSSGDFVALKVKKSLKRLIREDGHRTPLRVLSTGCLKLCPKGGIGVCVAALFARPTPGLVILRSPDDISNLYGRCRDTYSGE